MDDERAREISGVLGNKTCKKIIDLLSEKESSEKEIANSLNIPMNTVEYNLKKLLSSGLVEKTKNFFWSKKGKKIPTYKISNKSIIISPKLSNISRKMKSFVLVLASSGIVALLIRQFYSQKEIMFVSESAQMLGRSSEAFFQISQNIWLWFFLGSLFAVILFIIINWRKI